MHDALSWRERGGAQHGMAQWQGYKDCATQRCAVYCLRAVTTSAEAAASKHKMPA